DPAGRWRQPVRRRRQTLRGRLVRAVRRTRPRGHRDLRLRCAVRRGQEEVPAGASGAQGRPGDQEPAVRGAAAVVDGDRCAGGGRGGVAGPAAASRPLRVTGLAEPRVSGDRAPVTRGARSRGPGIPYPLVLALLAGLVLVAATAGIAAGSVSLPPGQVWGILLHSAHPALAAPDWPPVRETIVLDVRLPRVLLCAVVGAGLSVCGMALQALVRNPLADPMLLGVSSGATVGAVLVVVFHMAWFGRFSLPLAAFGGALLALVLVYFLARSGGRMTTVRLVLAGVATAAVLSAVAGYLVITSKDPHSAESAMRWMLGGLAGTTWTVLWIPAAAVLAGTAVLLGLSRRLNLLLAGEEA